MVLRKKIKHLTTRMVLSLTTLIRPAATFSRSRGRRAVRGGEGVSAPELTARGRTLAPPAELLPIIGRITYLNCQRTGGDHRPQPDDIITKSRKVFLRGRGKIRGGALQRIFYHNTLSIRILRCNSRNLFLRGSERNRGGAKK